MPDQALFVFVQRRPNMQASRAASGRWREFRRIAEEEALNKGMEAKSKELAGRGAEVYGQA